MNSLQRALYVDVERWAVTDRDLTWAQWLYVFRVLEVLGGV